MSEPGVVDPIRIPDWLREPAERWWREMPPLARLFVGLALLDVVGRSLGILPPAIQWAYMTPLAVVAAYVPHDLWILLPALLLIRRPDALDATPWVLRGAIVVATVELLRAPLTAPFGYDSTGDATISTWISMATSVGLLTGWVLLGRGLGRLNPRPPSQTAAGLSNLLAAGVVAIVLLDLYQAFAGPALDIGDPGLNQLLALGNLLAAGRDLGWAYLLWIAVRGLGDSRRPAEATIAAAVGAGFAAVLGLFGTLVTTIEILLARPLDPTNAFLGDLGNAFYWLAFTVAPSLIVVAFALGLAEPPIPYEGRPRPAGATGPVDEAADPPEAPGGADAVESAATPASAEAPSAT